MIEISKNEFIKRVTENKTLFGGLSYNELQLDGFRQMVSSGRLPSRECKVTGYRLVFSNDSVLDLNNNEFTKYTCFEDGNELIVRQDNLSATEDDSMKCKYMYYSVVK